MTRTGMSSLMPVPQNSFLLFLRVLSERHNNRYFVATEDSPGGLAAKLPGRRGERRGSGHEHRNVSVFICSCPERNKIKILLRSGCGCDIIIA